MRTAAQLLFVAFLFSLFPHTVRAVVFNQIDNFQDGTADGWQNGQIAAANIATGGPAGIGDRFMQVNADGSGGQGRMIIFNRAQWLGNYNAAGVNEIEMDVKDLGSGPLHLRLAFKDGTGSGAAGYASTTAIDIINTGNWTHAIFDLTAMAPINSPAESLSTLLGAPAEFRILSSASPALDGDILIGSLGIDNIHATSIPEPSSVVVLTAAAGCMPLLRRRLVKRHCIL